MSGKMSQNQNRVLKDLINIFSIEEVLPVKLLNIVNNSNISRIQYKGSIHAVEFEIDWREPDVFVFLVNLKNGNYPGVSDYYKYSNEKRSRVYIEEALGFSNQIYVEKPRIRHTIEFVYEKSKRYAEIIRINKERLANFLQSP